MSKTYISETPFNTSLSMTCDGMASYRLPGSTLSAINKFALKHRITMEATSSGEHAAYSLYLSLCMLVVEYKMNDERVAHRQLLMTSPRFYDTADYSASSRNTFWELRAVIQPSPVLLIT